MNKSNAELRDQLAAAGKTLTAKQREKLAEQQHQQARAIAQQYDTERPDEKTDDNASWADRVLSRVPSVVGLIHDVGMTLTTIAQSLIPASLPFLLVALFYAEAERVRYGVLLFEAHDYLAYIVAYILVLGNAFVELAIQRRYETSGYEKSTGFQWSLRLWWENTRYRIGNGDEWKARPKSPALRLERAQVGLTGASLFLAVGGSMTTAIEQAPGNWRQGIASIFIDSSLLEMMTWIGGLVAAVVIVWLAQLVVAYSYEQAADYYNELLARRDELTNNTNPDYERWLDEKQQAQQEARDRVERDLLLKALSKVEALPEELDRPKEPYAMNGTH